MTLLNIRLRSVFLLLLFFPSIIIFRAGTSGIFPYGILMLFFLRRISRRQTGAEFALLLAVIYGALVGVANDAPPGEFIRSLATYMNVLIPSIYLLSHQDASEDLLRRIPIIFWVMCTVGLVQISGILPNFIEGIFQTVIPNFSASVDVDGAGRGARVLSSEQSRAGYEFAVISILYCWLRHSQGKRYTFQLVVSVLVILFVIRSGTAAFLVLVAFVAFSPLKGILVFAISVFGITLISGGFVGRGLSLIQGVLARNDLGQVYLLLLEQSGFRLISNLASYSSFILNPFGYGVGQWQTSSIVTLDALDLFGTKAAETAFFRDKGFLHAVRTTSFFGQLVLDAGVPAVLASIYYVVSRSMSGLNDKFFRSLFAVFLAITMLVGDGGNPVPWVALSLMICCGRFMKRVPAKWRARAPLSLPQRALAAAEPRVSNP